MKRSFLPPARDALCAVLGALACGAACEPNNNVKPGAPELIEFTIVQAGPKATTVTPDTPDCAAIMTGSACMPAPAPTAVPDTLCRLVNATTTNWCTCTVTDPTGDPNVGTWGCDPFTDVMAVVAVFDRLLDTTPLDPGDAPGRMDIVMTSASAGTPAIDVLTDYSSTGDKNGLVFNLFGPAFFGNFRADGPSLFTAPTAPAFPANTTITFTLNADKVLAKDGHTVFTGAGPLMGGSLTFMTAAFSASVGTPDAMALMMDAGTPATVAFTNFVADDEAAMRITAATSTGTPITIMTASADNGASFSVTPAKADAMGMLAADQWPAGATVVITVAAATKDKLAETIDAAATGMFTVP